MDKIDSDINKAKTLPGSFYRTKEFFEKSKEKIFAKSWQYIGDDSLVKIEKSAHPFNFIDGLIEEPLFLIKNNDNKEKCYSNVCTHRGNILIESPCIINKDITCGYHGRRFDMCGKFLSMPETKGMENFPCKSDDLTEVPLKKWKQFLFSSLDPAIDFKDLFSFMDSIVGWMPIENFIYDPIRSRDYLVKSNWALYCDNYLEGFHIPFIHKDLAKTLDYSQYNTVIDKYCNLQKGFGTGSDFCFDLPESSEDYGKEIAAYYFWLFPNIMFNFYPWGLSLNIIKPISEKLTKVEFRTYIWDESKIDLGAGAILDKVEREDEAIVEKVQKGVSSRFYKHGRFSPRMEKGVHHFHQLISNFLNKE